MLYQNFLKIPRVILLNVEFLLDINALCKSLYPTEIISYFCSDLLIYSLCGLFIFHILCIFHTQYQIKLISFKSYRFESQEGKTDNQYNYNTLFYFQ